MNNNAVKGYKIFEPDWTCRCFQYEVGKTFEEDIVPSVCKRGFHFCVEASDCFNYYSFDSDNKVAEIIALGDIDTDGEKFCTNKIKIVREVRWEELLTIVNKGKCNTGINNIGDYNTGDKNTGERNTGDRNTGYYNTGNRNAGSYNTGDRNIGNWCTGDSNVRDCNTGDKNAGDRNTGNKNIGNWNAGNCNAGNRNTGDCNTGDKNTGNYNVGNNNTGYWNTGSCNTGDWNISSFNTGCFMTKESKISMFDKPSDWFYRDWIDSDARHLLNQIPKKVVEWVYEADMSYEEKYVHTTYKNTGGYLRVLGELECIQIWWDGLTECQKDIIKALPNFDAEIFERCTGIKIGYEEENNG